MPLEPEVMKQLIATFKTELDERLQTITAGLLSLEKTQKKQGDSQKIIEEIFRAAHNIKGSARGLGIQTIGDIVHHIESIFASIKEKKTSITPALINLCLSSVDSIRLAMQAFCDNKPLPFDLEALLKELALQGSSTNPSTKPNTQTTTPTTEPTTTPSTTPTTTPNTTPNMAPTTTPSMAPTATPNMTSTTEPNCRGLTAASTDPINTPSNTTPEKPDLTTNEYETIRVPLSQVENISALIEQMQITKIGIEENYRMLTKLDLLCKEAFALYENDNEDLTEMNFALHKIHKSMHISVNELSTITNALQEEMRMLRLVPAATLLQHFSRSVRSLGQELNKEIEFEISGAQVKMDKMILEGLKDPIMHLLRNAIDHGIESPELRKQQGKPEYGKINIDVMDEGNQILINVSDDGCGIDYKKVAETAIKRKMVTEAEIGNMTEDAILDLIFRPEFSTKEIITTVSGRGVGLDVVKSNLSDLKGTVSFSTQPGKGSCFHLNLPLTLASDIGLTIKSGGQWFVVPVSAIERILLISSIPYQTSLTLKNTNWREKIYPLL
jgi:two-component system chemotaxis sensor kinase CheA